MQLEQRLTALLQLHLSMLSDQQFYRLQNVAYIRGLMVAIFWFKKDTKHQGIFQYGKMIFHS